MAFSFIHYRTDPTPFANSWQNLHMMDTRCLTPIEGFAGHQTGWMTKWVQLQLRTDTRPRSSKHSLV